MNTASKACEFLKKYPMTIAWRIQKNASIIEKHLNPGEEITYVFAGQKNREFYNLFGTAVIALTNKRLLIGRDRVVYGYFFDAITPDLFNDLKVRSGLLWGSIDIDTVKEFITISHLDKKALAEVETAITSFMMEEKQKMGLKKREED